MCMSSVRFHGIWLDILPKRNKTVLCFARNLNTDDETGLKTVDYFVNGVCMPHSSFLAVVICTGVLSIKLNQNLAWRSSNISLRQLSLKKIVVNSRNKRLSKWL